MMRKFYVLFALAISSLHASARQEDATGLNPGFVHFYNNEFDEALSDFQAQLRSSPQDASLENDVAQTILYREMFRNGSLESQLVTGTNAFLRRPKMEISDADRRAFSEAVQKSLAISSAKLQGSPRDVNALYSGAVAHGLMANYLFLVEKSWLKALHEAVAGREMNDRILSLQPEFVDAHLIHGLVEYVVGCLPGYLRVLGSLRGFHGDKEDGIKQLEMVASRGVLNRYDASILLAAIYRREHRPNDALPLLDSLSAKFPRNYLLRLEQVQMYSDLGKKEPALLVLDKVEEFRRSGAKGYANLPKEKLLYARGNLLFWYGELQPAKNNLTQVTDRSADLDLSTATMGLLRLGQVNDLLGDHAGARESYDRLIALAPKSEPALEAKNYRSNPYTRKRGGT